MRPHSSPAVPAERPDSTAAELTDDDVLEAMRAIPGYLDITASDFRAVYRLARRQALERLLAELTAERLMRREVRPLRPELRCADAIPFFLGQDLKSLPVVDESGHVIGMFTETDALRALGADTAFDLLAAAMSGTGAGEGNGRLAGASLDRLAERRVGTLMTAPAVSVPWNAAGPALLAAFAHHPGRAMPVVGPDGRLVGLLARKVFLAACPAREAA